MKKILIILAVFFSFLLFASAEINDTNQTDINQSITNIASVSVPELEIINFMPKEANLGDVQLSIQVKNDKNETLDNLMAFVTGNGFSTYEVIPIQSLSRNEKDYIFVSGNFKEAGNITLSININSNIFSQNITIIDYAANQAREDELKRVREKAELLQNLSGQLNELKQNYSNLEDELSFKKDENFDVSKASLAELKSLIQNIQSNILSGNADNARVNLNLALDEYNYQKRLIDNAKEISWLSRIKDNAVLFSAIAGAFITFFVLFELLKNKTSHVASKISERVKRKKNLKKAGKRKQTSI